jgi:hypothetical protein
MLFASREFCMREEKAFAWSASFGAALCLLVFDFWSSGAVLRHTPEQTQASTRFHEEAIAEITPGSRTAYQIVSHSHAAWVENLAPGGVTVNLDGKRQGGVYLDARYLALSPDGTHFVFSVRRGLMWTIILDDREYSPRYEKTTSVVFRPQGDSIAYGACREKNHCRLVVNGDETGSEYDDISYPLYSRDGKRLAYLGKRDKKWVAVVDGKEMDFRSSAVWSDSWGFSPDGTRFFVAASNNISWTSTTTWTYVVDDSPGPQFQALSYITFTPDGRHYAYGGTNLKGIFRRQKAIGAMILDGRSVGSYEGRGVKGLLGAMAGTADNMVLGVRNLFAELDGVSTPQFSPEGTLVYAARRGKGNVTLFAENEAGPGFDDILSPVVFSDDSRHSTYVARRGTEFVEVRDNSPVRVFPAGKSGATGVEWIVTTRDAAHLAFEAVIGGARYKGAVQHSTGGVLYDARLQRAPDNTPSFDTSDRPAVRSVVIDGKAGPEYEAMYIGAFDFASVAGHHFYEIIGLKRGGDLVNIDGHESRLYDAVWSPPVVLDNNLVTFVARDGWRLLRVTFPLAGRAAGS